MKIEKIENDKIKVSLTEEDLVFYDLSQDTVTPDSPKLHKFLFEIMDSVVKQTGFDPYSGQVVVEAFQHKSGITLLISKLKTVGQTIEPKKAKTVRISKNIRKNRYIIENFHSLCKALALTSFSELKNSSIYKYEEKWYVTVFAGRNKINCILSEFCDSIAENMTEVFLTEHGELVAKGDNLISMVKGIKSLD